ncbi:MAG: SRPBCC domain-containing protein [Caldilineaceae bacterium]|nr:SRPBCC domain-containing protein [Caldilineaceae bacterium]
MTETTTTFPPINKQIIIHAPATMVWDYLTKPELMQQWMTEEPITIQTAWRVGTPMVISGQLHGFAFENTGTVLQSEPTKRLQYTHRSSISNLPDEPASYTVFTFQLTPTDNQTTLTITVENFPTESIYKHLAFYWHVVPELLRKRIESVG